MLIYRCYNKFFLYGKVERMQVLNKNHAIYFYRGSFPGAQGIPVDMVLPIHVVNNRYQRLFDQACRANIVQGTLIFMKVTYTKGKYFMNQFLFQGQMKYYEDTSLQLPERNLFVGKITRILTFRNQTLCLQMPIKEKNSTKWMNLLVKEPAGISPQQIWQKFAPMEGVEKKQYQTAIVLAGKEIMYQGYQQSDILRIY